jgi:polysaccharide biosynthesis PFTS motif protein
MNFRINYSTLKGEHQRISDGDLFNNLRGAIDKIIKNAKKKNSLHTINSLSDQLNKYDEFFSIYLLFSSDTITQALLKSKLRNKKIKFPLKKEWIRVFEEYGFPINRKISLIKYRIFCLNIYLRQNIKIIKFIFHKYNGINFQKSAVILGSKKENYLSGNLKNFGNWINARISDKEYNKIFVECISDKNNSLSNDYVYIDSFEKNLFPISVRNFIVLFIKSLYKNRPRRIYLKQPYLATLSLFVRDNSQNLPDSVYLTTSLPWIKTPTFHFMELAGTKIIYINTSLAIDPQVTGKNNHVNWSEFSEWNEIWCVSDLQVRHLKQIKLINQPIFFNMGVPDWNDSPNDQLFDESFERKKSVSIFDYEPNVKYFGYSSLNDLHLSFEDTIFQFIQEITVIAQNYNFNVYHKAKRDVGNKRLKNYETFLNQLKVGNKNFISVDPKHSARKLIKSTNGTISIPFTSTSIIAKEESKPCAYFDPNGKVDPSDSASSEIKVLLNLDDLENWFKNLN